jgi:hypothetical protein
VAGVLGRGLRQYDFHPWGGLRPAIWHDEAIPWWYRQNLIVFTRGQPWEPAAPGAPAQRLTMIHPECYLWALHRGLRPRTTHGVDQWVYATCAAGQWVTPPGYGSEGASDGRGAAPDGPADAPAGPGGG